jgi:hypothetical protein
VGPRRKSKAAVTRAGRHAGFFAAPSRCTTEAIANCLHIKCSVVMPGHVGTSIPLNSRKIQSGNQSDAMWSAHQVAGATRSNR